MQLVPFGRGTRIVTPERVTRLRCDELRGWLDPPHRHDAERADPTARNFARAVLLQGAIHVVGGSPTPDSSHASEGSATVESYRVTVRDVIDSR